MINENGKINGMHINKYQSQLNVCLYYSFVCPLFMHAIRKINNGRYCTEYKYNVVSDIIANMSGNNNMHAYFI